MKMEELAKELDRLKHLLREPMKDYRANPAFIKARRKLEDQLEVCGLGLQWQDSEECYMVYSLESIKE